MSMTLSKPIASRVHPKQFLLWAAIGSMVMLFAGLTSAYIVRRAQGNWVEFQLPPIFWVSTVVILLSSATLYLAAQAFKKDNLTTYRRYLGWTLLLGIGFLILQYVGWRELTSYGILLEGNPSGSFVYVISGFHFVHVIGGVFFLLLFYWRANRRRDPVGQLLADTLPDKQLGVNLLSTYWHFVDVLWLYLFAFFLFYQ